MAQAVPSARLVEIPDAGHLVMLERSDIVNDEIALLLKAVQSP
jgi:pimeloyl-ACP methyl ester carboxylesterase